MNDLGIAILACHRPHCLINCLSSLCVQQQNNIHLWIDCSTQEYRHLNIGCKNIAQKVFPYIDTRIMEKHIGTARMMCDYILPYISQKYRNIIFIEEDVFLTSFAIKEIYNAIQNMDTDVFSVFGDHAPDSTEFRSICWGTTSDKLMYILPILMRLHGQPDFLKQYLIDNNTKYLELCSNKSNVLNRTFISNPQKYNFISCGEMIGYVGTVNGYYNKRTPRVCTYHIGVDEFGWHYQGVQIERQSNPVRHLDIPYAWGKFLTGENK